MLCEKFVPNTKWVTVNLYELEKGKWINFTYPILLPDNASHSIHEIHKIYKAKKTKLQEK